MARISWHVYHGTQNSPYNQCGTSIGPDSHHKATVIRNCVVVIPNTVEKTVNCPWCEAPWRSYDVILMSHHTWVSFHKTLSGCAFCFQVFGNCAIWILDKSSMVIQVSSVTDGVLLFLALVVWIPWAMVVGTYVFSIWVAWVSFIIHSVM